MSGSQVFMALGALAAGVFVIGSLWYGVIPHGFKSTIDRKTQPVGYWTHIAFGVATFLTLAWFLFRSGLPGRISG